jgi:histidinol-phosphate aminotransferase
MPPTYGMYEVSAEINCTEIRKVNLTPDFQIDTQKVLTKIDEKTKMIFVCSPNNPTGNCLNTNDILTLAKHFQGLLVIDEAYIDFANQISFIHQIKNYPNIIVLQTFSKAFGLAGLRLGMAFANEAIIQIINKIKPPYNIGELTQRLVLESLDNLEKVQFMLKTILEERSILIQAFQALSFILKVYPTDANFILVKVTDAQRLYDYLVNHQIIVRNRSKIALCEGCLRITVGTKTENELLLQALENYSTY